MSYDLILEPDDANWRDDPETHSRLVDHPFAKCAETTTLSDDKGYVVAFGKRVTNEEVAKLFMHVLHFAKEYGFDVIDPSGRQAGAPVGGPVSAWVGTMVAE